MVAPVDVVNLALLEAGNTVQVNSIFPPDNTPAAQAGALFYVPKIQALLRAAPWNFCRAQTTLTQLKAYIVGGAVSSNPPPQPWGFEYAYPPDCLRFRFLQPTITTAPPGTPLTTAPNLTLPVPNVPTGVPFVEATDYDASGNVIKVLLTQMGNAQGVYTRDLSMFPQFWDPLFLSAATAVLASYLCNALTRNKAQMEGQIAIAKGALDTARGMNASESITNQDRIPDWIQVRMASSIPWAWNTGGPAGVYSTGWDAMSFPNGLTY